MPSATPTLTEVPPGLLLPAPTGFGGVDFDGIQRYGLLARLLDRMLAAVPRPVRLLEVGSNVLNPLPQFLDAGQFHLTRCDVDAFCTDPDFVRIEKDKPLPFADGAFDAVIALEVLEHIPRGGRPFFLTECLRVARHGAVFTCPNGVPEVVEAEALVNQAYAHRNAQPHHFLCEHQECGLPTEDEIRAILRRLGHPHAVLNNSPLEVWLPLILLTQTLMDRTPHWPRLYERINQAFYPGVHDPGRLSYRKVYVVAKTEAARAAVQPLPEANALPAQGTGLPRPLAHLQTLATAAADTLAEVEQELLATRQQAQADMLWTREHWHVAHSLLGAVTASRAWKLTRLVRSLRRAVRPCRYLRQDLVPFHDLEPAADGPAGTWLARGPGARFLAVGLMPAGWVRVRLRLKSEGAAGAVLYADVGTGFYPIVSCTADQMAAGVAVDRYFKFPGPLRAVRLDPLDARATGRVHVEEFRVESLTLPRLLARKLGIYARNLRARGGWLRAVAGDLLLLPKGRFAEFKTWWREDYQRAPVRSGPGVKFGPGSDPLSPDPGAYEAWRRLRELTDDDRDRLAVASWSLAPAPTVSVLLPAGAVPEPYLRGAVESVLRQTYPRWELCLVGDRSLGFRLQGLLREFVQRDARIKVSWADLSQGSPAALQRALEMVGGDAVMLLRQEDELAEHALFKVTEALAADPDLAMVYSDEDRLTADGRHTDPFFKPDWSPEYFLAGMYTGHMAAYRTALVRQLGGFRGEFGAAQEYDLALRIAARASRIGHIPDVLYHARKLPGGASAETQAEADAAARRALEIYLAATGRPGQVLPGALPGSSRVRFALNGRPKVSIIIPSSCRLRPIGGELTSHVLKCLPSLRRRTTYDHYEVLVVGQDEIPPRVALGVAEWGAVHVPYAGPLNIAAKMNAGAAAATGEHLLFLNDDTEVITPNWIECLLEFSQQPEVGAVGAKLLFPDGRIQHAGVVFFREHPYHLCAQFPGDHPGYFGSNVLHRNYLAVTGACLMTRAEVFRSVGGFSEEFPLNFNDIDYCLKVARAGKRIVYQPHAQLYHWESVSRPCDRPEPVAEKTFKDRWRAVVGRDPFFNVNLAMDLFTPRVAADKSAEPAPPKEKRQAA